MTLLTYERVCGDKRKWDFERSERNHPCMLPGPCYQECLPVLALTIALGMATT